MKVAGNPQIDGEIQHQFREYLKGYPINNGASISGLLIIKAFFVFLYLNHAKHRPIY